MYTHYKMSTTTATTIEQRLDDCMKRLAALEAEANRKVETMRDRLQHVGGCDSKPPPPLSVSQEVKSTHTIQQGNKYLLGSSEVVAIKGGSQLLELKRGEVTWPSFPTYQGRNTWNSFSEWRTAVGNKTDPILLLQKDGTQVTVDNNTEVSSAYCMKEHDRYRLGVYPRITYTAEVMREPNVETETSITRGELYLAAVPKSIASSVKKWKTFTEWRTHVNNFIDPIVCVRTQGVKQLQGDSFIVDTPPPPPVVPPPVAPPPPPVVPAPPPVEPTPKTRLSARGNEFELGKHRCRISTDDTWTGPPFIVDSATCKSMPLSKWRAYTGNTNDPLLLVKTANGPLDPPIVISEEALSLSRPRNPIRVKAGQRYRLGTNSVVGTNAGQLLELRRGEQTWPSFKEDRHLWNSFEDWREDQNNYTDEIEVGDSAPPVVPAPPVVSAPPVNQDIARLITALGTEPTNMYLVTLTTFKGWSDEQLKKMEEGRKHIYVPNMSGPQFLSLYSMGDTHRIVRFWFNKEYKKVGRYINGEFVVGDSLTEIGLNPVFWYTGNFNKDNDFTCVNV